MRIKHHTLVMMFRCPVVSVNIFDYVSTPVIFVILGLEIIYFDHYNSLNSAQLAAAISKVSFCVYVLVVVV